jgi:hypothetical protein
MSIIASLQTAELVTDDYHGHYALAFSQLQNCGTWTEDEESWTPHDYLTPIEHSDAMDVGTLVHASYYEPDCFPGMYAIRPEKNGRTVASNTTEFVAWAIENQGKIQITKKQHGEVLRIRNAALASSVAQSYARRNSTIVSTETPYLATDPLTGLAIRIKPDRLRLAPDGTLICEDLKTTRAPTPKEFRRECDIHKYHRRFAFYRHAMSVITGIDPSQIRCVFIAVQNDEPYAAFVAEADPLKLDAAQKANDDCMIALAQCIKNGNFQPRWMKEPIFV